MILELRKFIKVLCILNICKKEIKAKVEYLIKAFQLSKHLLYKLDLMHKLLKLEKEEKKMFNIQVEINKVYRFCA
jgi:hypothetical protein